ncbi:hypothetical protein BOX15_Mlig024765g3, partial [Macrostomum lignano]
KSNAEPRQLASSGQQVCQLPPLVAAPSFTAPIGAFVNIGTSGEGKPSCETATAYQLVAPAFNFPASTLASSSTPVPGCDAAGGSAGGGSGGPSSTSSSVLIGAGEPSDYQKRKRANRLEKNREAARICRQKKKDYIKCLESRVRLLTAQNRQLMEELEKFKVLLR